jgi:hypothetical protein
MIRHSPKYERKELVVNTSTDQVKRFTTGASVKKIMVVS